MQHEIVENILTKLYKILYASSWINVILKLFTIQLNKVTAAYIYLTPLSLNMLD